MNLLRLSWKNILHKPLNTLLNILLLALGIGLIALLLLLQRQLQDNFEKNLAGIDLVIGAKGSPLQLILSNMYHIDAPTGNISLAEAKPFLRPDHPIIGEAVPLSLGDNYRGYRIVGATPALPDWYGAELAAGEMWRHNFEVTIGARVAEQLGLVIGDRFRSSHGFVDEKDMDHEHEEFFRVVGILKPTGTVADQLIFTTPQSFWLVHGHGEASPPAGDADDHGHDHHHHHHDHDPHPQEPLPLLEEEGEREITALLVRYKVRNFQALNMQRNINENTDLQAATPAIEINRLFNLVAVGEQVLRWLAIVIVVVSGLSIFISLFASLRERRYELALMRVMGASRARLFLLVVLEGLLLSFAGFAVGVLISHLGVELLPYFLRDSARYGFTGRLFLTEEWWLLGGALALGLLASVLPAARAARSDISETLSRK